MLVLWPYGWFTYNQQRYVPLSWHGTLVEQKRDQSGALYRRARYADPATGRFTQEDPIGLAGGVNLYGFAGADPVNFGDPFGLCKNAKGFLACLWDFAKFEGRGFMAGASMSALPDDEHGSAGWLVGRILGAASGGAAGGVGRAGSLGQAGEGVEVVQRAMSRAELEATIETGLVRGGRAGTHFVSDAVNTSGTRARQRLALANTPEVQATMEVPRGAFSKPSGVEPANGMPGGGMERTATGPVSARILRVQEYH
ncbi:MAG: RHS repeat-associated core domain-containing protein [Gemmatimonadaceae bacterium]